MPDVTEIYASLIDDPDVIPPEDVSKEDYALMLAQQRVKQHVNNEKALNLGLTKLLKYTGTAVTDTAVTNGHSTNGHTAVSAVKKLSSFVKTTNKHEDLLEQALLLMLKKGVPEAFDRLFNMANQYNKEPLNPEGTGKKDSGIQSFYRTMINLVHPDTAANRFGLTKDLVYDDEMKAEMDGYNSLFQETAKHVNALNEVIKDMGDNDTIEDALRKYEESSPIAYKSMEDGLTQYFKEDGSRRSDERMNQTRNRAVRLKQIKDWADENNVDFDPNHPDLSVENDQRGREIKLDANRINSYLRNTHRGEGEAPQWDGPPLKNTRIPKAKPKVKTPKRNQARSEDEPRVSSDSTEEDRYDSSDIEAAFIRFNERKRKADRQFDRGLFTEEQRDAEVQAAGAEFEAAVGFSTEEEARSQPQAEREEEVEVEDDPDAGAQAAADAADAAEEAGPEDDSDEGQERDKAFFNELTGSMSGNAKEEFNRAFTDDGFKDYVKQVSDMGGNFDGIKTVTQARNHINDVASDPNHPHADIIDKLLEDDDIRDRLSRSDAGDLFTSRHEENIRQAGESEEGPAAEEEPQPAGGQRQAEGTLEDEGILVDDLMDNFPEDPQQGRASVRDLSNSDLTDWIGRVGGNIDGDLNDPNVRASAERTLHDALVSNAIYPAQDDDDDFFGPEAVEPEETPQEKLHAHLTASRVDNPSALTDTEAFKDAWETNYSGETEENAVKMFIEDYPDLAELQGDNSEFKTAIDAHVGVAEEDDTPAEEPVEEEPVEEEAVEEEPVEEPAEAAVEEPAAAEAEPEAVAEEPEEEIDAEVGARWDTVLDPARGGGIRFAMMHGLIDTDGNITDIGKEFFDHVGGMYNDARNLVNDNFDQFEGWRKTPRPGFPEGYDSARNPIKDSHKLSGVALNSLIGQYNRAGGRDAAGKLNKIYDMPRGVRGENFFGHEGVTPIEDAQSPSVEDMHMDQIDHTHVLNAVLRGHISNSSHVDHVTEILEHELRDRGASPDQAAEIVETAMATVDRSEQPEEEPSGSPSNQEAEQGQWDEFLDQASEQVHENVDQEAERVIPQLMAGPIPNEPSSDQWEQQRQYPMFENLVSDEQASKWGLAGDFYRENPDKLIEQFNQAGVAARAADGASADKYDIPAPKPEQAEMDLGPEADQPVEREPLDEAGRQQQQAAERQAASAERAKADREAEQGQFDLPTQEELPLEEPSAEQVAQDRKDKLNAERREKLTPEARLREDRVKELKEVMHEDNHAHLDNPNAYTEKEIESKCKKEVRDKTAKTKAEVAEEEGAAVDEADEKAEEVADKRKGQAAEATKNTKKGRATSDGSEVKFDSQKALGRLAALENPHLEEGSDEMVEAIKKLDDHYDPSIGMHDKKLEADVVAAHALTANQKKEKATAEKNKADDRTRVNAHTELEQFQTPEDFAKDETNNPDGEKMAPELATEHARKLLGFWHENIDALKDSEHHMAAGQKLKQYIDAGADHELLNDELKEMEAQGILGDKDKMVGYHEENRKGERRTEAEKVVHQTKLEQAIKNVHADRSTDEDGNPIHHRMDHTGDLEAVSPEDAGIEHTDSDTPHLGHIGEDGNIDEKAEELYQELHEAKKLQPHDDTKLKQRKADSDHHERVSESAAAHKEIKDTIDSDKDVAHKRNDDSVEQGVREEVEGHFDRIDQLQDDHQAELDQHDADHQDTQDNLDRLVDTHTQAVESNAAQGARINDNHFKGVQENLKENDFQNKLITHATRQKRAVQQAQEQNWNNIHQKGLDTLEGKQKKELADFDPDGYHPQGAEQALADLKEKHGAENQQRRESAEDQYKSNRQRDKQILDEHNDGIQQMSDEMGAKNDDLQQQRQDAHFKTNETLNKVEASHLETINEERKKRGEEPLTGKQDIQHELQQEKGVATEVHTDKRDAAIKAHGEAAQGALEEHEAVKQKLGDNHKAEKEGIDGAAAGHHKENDDLHNDAVEASHGQKAQDHADATDPLVEGEAQYAGGASQAAEQAFDDHMKAGGASEEQIARAKKNPNLGKNAAGNELDHEDEGKGEHTEEEQRDGNKGQTRMVDDPSGKEGAKKQQVWVPGRGKGWVDKDKMDSASGDNMDAAGGKPSGKMMIYPAGAEGNPFDGPMAGHGGNWHSIETDNPLASGHPDAAGHGHEDVIAHSLGNSLNAAGHDMSGDKPFEVNASDHGFGGSEHGATNKREPKEGTPEEASQVFGEKAQARAADVGAQVRAAKTAADKITGGRFTGAMAWLKQKADESETMQSEIGKFKADVAREEATTPTDVGGSLAEGLRSLRHRKERISGGKYPRMGLAQGFGPDKQGKAKLSEEAARYSPFKSKKMKVKHSVTNYREKESAVANFGAFIDEASKPDPDDKYKK